jgi:hypothetical protein
MMKMRSVFVRALLLAAVTSMVAPAQPSLGIEGKWRSEREVGDADGKTYSHVTTFTFKVSEAVLTGSVVATSGAPWMQETTGKTVEIQNGSVEGNKISFRIVQEGKSGARTAIYEATVSGDRINGVVKFRGIGQTWNFVATRVD